MAVSYKDFLQVQMFSPEMLVSPVKFKAYSIDLL